MLWLFFVKTYWKIAERIQIDPGFYLMFASSLLLIPLRWLIAWFVAVAIHELSHIGVLLASRSRIDSISIHVHGMQIRTETLPTYIELLAAAAGPAGSLLLLLLYRHMPLVSLCGFIQGLFNLIPLHPMDGGRVLKCLFVVVLGFRIGEMAVSLVSTMIGGVLLVWAVLSLRVSILPLILVLPLIIKQGKFPCKTLVEGVQ